MTHESVTSLSLLQRIRNGDQAGWSRVVELYSPLVHYWCRRGGIDGADADDVQQEVFQAAAQGIATFRRDREGDTFRGWLRAICHHKVVAVWRSRNRDPEAVGGSDAWQRLQEVADRGPTTAEADDGDEGTQVSALFHRALEQLKGEFEPRSWRAFWRVTVDGQTSATVAGELGMSPTAVRMAKSRVLHRLREELGDLVD